MIKKINTTLRSVLLSCNLYSWIRLTSSVWELSTKRPPKLKISRKMRLIAQSWTRSICTNTLPTSSTTWSRNLSGMCASAAPQAPAKCPPSPWQAICTRRDTAWRRALLWLPWRLRLTQRTWSAPTCAVNQATLSLRRDRWRWLLSRVFGSCSGILRSVRRTCSPSCCHWFKKINFKSQAPCKLNQSLASDSASCKRLQSTTMLIISTRISSHWLIYFTKSSWLSWATVTISN